MRPRSVKCVGEAPKHFRKAEQKLAKRQRAFSRTKKGSKGHEKARLKVARCHQKIKNQRNNQKSNLNLKRRNFIITSQSKRKQKNLSYRLKIKVNA